MSDEQMALKLRTSTGSAKGRNTNGLIGTGQACRRHGRISKPELNQVQQRVARDRHAVDLGQIAKTRSMKDHMVVALGPRSDWSAMNRSCCKSAHATSAERPAVLLGRAT